MILTLEGFKKKQISWQDKIVTAKKWFHLSAVGKDSIWHRDIELIGEFHALSPLVRQTNHPRMWLHHKSHFLISRENTIPVERKKNLIMAHKALRIQVLMDASSQKCQATSSC